MADKLGQTITVVNKSGKVVSTSKHLVNIFKEARAAYRERKAELQAERTADVDLKKEKPAKTIEQASSAPPSPVSPSTARQRAPPSTASARHHSSRQTSHRSSGHESSRPSRRGSAYESGHRQHHSHRPDTRRSKPPTERAYTDSYHGSQRPRRVKTDGTPKSPLRFMEEAENEWRGKELVRRHSYADAESLRTSSGAVRERPSSGIDMDLAYGELPPPAPGKTREDEEELKLKVTALNRILEEAQCLQHTATAIIKNLENNPEAMAAVGLTLAEISGLVTKLGPGALAALKASFPAVVALLISPEFLIAAGVGVGVTVIAFGGYKIIKKIRSKKDAEKAAQSPEKLEELEVEVDLNNIENWRRGIADVEAASDGTSVDGEFITPGAAAELRRQGKLPPLEDGKKSDRDARKKREKEAKAAKEREAKEQKAKKVAEKKLKEDQKAADKAEKKSKKDQAIRDRKKAEDDMLL